MKRTIIALTIAASAIAAQPAESASTARSFSNCTSMNRTYPHGVGRPGARDRTSGTPVRNFKRSRALYNANTGRDRDKDGIACEKA